MFVVFQYIRESELQDLLAEPGENLNPRLVERLGEKLTAVRCCHEFFVRPVRLAL